MAIRHTQTDKLALGLLARNGITAIQNLRVAAAGAHGAADPAVATAIIEIARPQTRHGWGRGSAEARIAW